MKRVIAFGTAIVTAASLLVATPPAAAAPERWEPPAVAATRAVEGSAGKILPPKPDGTAGQEWTPPQVSWPRAGVSEVNTVKGMRQARAGDLPVWVGSAARVELFDRGVSDRFGVSGPVLSVGGIGRVPITIDYSTFRYAIGGGWANRLRLVELPSRKAVPSTNNTRLGRLSATVAAGSTIGITADPLGPAGDYTATALSPSATWKVDAHTGDVNWSYPLRVPPPPGDLVPKISIGYSSGSVDGRTVSTNQQPSWIGEGFDYSPGFVERGYKSCQDDNIKPKKGDLCWAYDNAVLSLNGQTIELIRDDTTGAYKPKADDGSRIERFTGTVNGDDNGEYWRLTTVDGTQYYFGLNRLPGWASGRTETDATWTVPVFGDDAGEPCHKDSFASSWCRQAWRWNLSYVVDTQGNAMSLFYHSETNYYGRNMSSSAATSYDRGGYLTEIRYGQRSDALFAAAPARVLFTTAERCVPTSTFDCAPSKFTKANAKYWPDVPFDQNCGSSSCGNFAPTFWSRKRLTTVTTQTRTGGSYRDVDVWSLDQKFLAPGDGTAPSLWLSAIRHTGKVGGSASVPDVKFGGVQLDNRVDAVEGIPAMTKWRVSSIDNGNGGQLSITYSEPDCVAGSTPAPASNTRRCFPTYWYPEGYEEPRLDWFHKYVVTQIVQVDRTGGAPFDVTSYDYLDGAAWHYDDDDGLVPAKRKTWSQWRGYSRVRITKGTGNDPRQVTEMLYYRGMDGDRTTAGGQKDIDITTSEGVSTPDSDALQGFLREELRYAVAGGAVTEGKVYDYLLRGPVATRSRSWGTTKAYLVRKSAVKSRTALAVGGWRRTEITTTYDNEGLPTMVDDKADTATSADDQCTRISYARDTARWMLNYVSRKETVAVACTAAPSRPADVVSDERTFYDGKVFGAAPTAGNRTRTEEISEYRSGTPVYVPKEVKTFDSYGRATSVTDAGGYTTTTAYTPTSGGLATKIVVTSQKGFQSTEEVEPAWGLPLSKVDPNGLRTDLAYDPLGRLVSVWQPGRSKSTQTPNIKHDYYFSATGAAAVASSTLNNSGTGYNVVYQLYDGLLRLRQKQQPAPGGGRVITDTIYNSRGRKVKVNEPYYTDGAPSGTLFVPVSDDEVPGQTLSEYDGLDRVTAEIFRVRGNERWRTTTVYGGDATTVTPPQGGTPTTKIYDARGNIAELRQYHGDAASGAYDSTTYTHSPAGLITSVTNAAGITWRYAYDLRRRRISETDPDKGTSTFTYDNRGNLISTRDARGVVLAHTYDEFGRRTGLYDNSPTGDKRAEWIYDTIRKGKLTATIRYTGGRAYRDEITGYDPGYRPTGRKITIPPVNGAPSGTFTTGIEYNVDGTVHRKVIPSAGRFPSETMLFGYNELGMPTTTRGMTTYITATVYSKLGQPLQMIASSGGKRVMVANYFEEGTNRLVRELKQRETGPHTVSDTIYQYNDVGNITAISDLTDKQCFRYDYLQRLSEAWTTDTNCATTPTSPVTGQTGPAPYWQSFTYDAAGRRLTHTDHGQGTTQTYGYAGGGTQPNGPRTITTSRPGVPATQTGSLSYDVAGNVTNRTVQGRSQALAWDAEGHLSSVTESGSTTTYVYTADGDRLLADTPSGGTLYLGDIEITLDSGRISTSRYYTHAGLLVAARSAGKLSWIFTDHHGTPNAAVDDVTQTPTIRRFTPFGEARGGATAFPGGRGFVGGDQDPTGMVHLGAREYDPGLGIFMSVDPVSDPADPQQLQPYAYSKHNPVTLSDPDGKYVIKIPLRHYYYSVWGRGYRTVVRATVYLVIFVFLGLLIPLGLTVSYRIYARYSYGRMARGRPRIVRERKSEPYRAQPLPRGNVRDPVDQVNIPEWLEKLLDGVFKKKLGKAFIPGRTVRELEKAFPKPRPKSKKPNVAQRVAGYLYDHIYPTWGGCLVLCGQMNPDSTLSVGGVGLVAFGGAANWSSAPPSEQASDSWSICGYYGVGGCLSWGGKSEGGHWWGISVGTGVGGFIGKWRNLG